MTQTWVEYYSNKVITFELPGQSDQRISMLFIQFHRQGMCWTKDIVKDIWAKYHAVESKLEPCDCEAKFSTTWSNRAHRRRVVDERINITIEWRGRLEWFIVNVVCPSTHFERNVLTLKFPAKITEVIKNLSGSLSDTSRYSSFQNWSCLKSEAKYVSGGRKINQTEIRLTATNITTTNIINKNTRKLQKYWTD